MKHMNLEEFMESPLRNCWIKYKNLSVYVRKGARIIKGERIKAIDIANMYSAKRASNLLRKTKVTSTGQYREFIALAKAMSEKHDFDGVYSENVVNEFLPDKLLELGFKKVDEGILGAPCFYWEKKNATATSV